MKRVFYPVLVIFIILISCQIKEGKEMSGVIKLPPPAERGSLSLEETILKRESVRSFKDKNLSSEEISQILWSCYGVKHADALTGASRTVPSAGACYPMEVYLVRAGGVFQYLSSSHALKKINDKDLRRPLAEACRGQGFIAQAPVSLVLTCVYNRMTGRYGTRGEQYAHMDAGHIGQNVSLQAVGLGLGTVMVGAFDDQAVQKVLGIPQDHVPLYVIPVGHPE